MAGRYAGCAKLIKYAFLLCPRSQSVVGSRQNIAPAGDKLACFTLG
jgi:hypothetical protein